MKYNIEEIYSQYSKDVLNYLFFLTDDRALSEDLMQETFYRATKNIDKFRGDCKISVWLCQIGKHLWYNQLRKRKGFKIISLEEDVRFDFDMDERIIRDEQKSKLHKQLAGLEEKVKELMYLRLTTQRTFKEIGNILGETESWARVTFYRTKEKMKEMNREEEKKYETK